MSRYDGLIIPRSYSEYINKTDAATLQQALQLSGVLSGTVAAGDNKAVKSDAVNTALLQYDKVYVDDTTPVSTTKQLPSLTYNGQRKYYYVDGTTEDLPNNWQALSTRGILKVTNIKGTRVYELTLWGYADKTTYNSKSNKYMRSSYYNGIQWKWEDWHVMSNI